MKKEENYLDDALDVTKYKMKIKRFENLFYNFVQKFKNKKKVKDRGRQGYCEDDLYDWGSFILFVIERSLIGFENLNTEHYQSYPGDGKYKSYAEWQAVILKIIDKLHNANCNYPDVIYNKYFKDVYKCRLALDIARNNGTATPEDEETFKKLNDNYIKEMEANDKRMEDSLKEAFKLIEENIGYLWV